MFRDWYLSLCAIGAEADKKLVYCRVIWPWSECRLNPFQLKAIARCSWLFRVSLMFLWTGKQGSCNFFFLNLKMNAVPLKIWWFKFCCNLHFFLMLQETCMKYTFTKRRWIFHSSKSRKRLGTLQRKCLYQNCHVIKHDTESVLLIYGHSAAVLPVSELQTLGLLKVVFNTLPYYLSEILKQMCVTKRQHSI